MLSCRAIALALFVFTSSEAAQATDVAEVAALDGANLQRPSWSPDGSRLAYEANSHSDRTIELYIGDPTNRTFLRLKGARRSTHPMTAGFVTSQPATHVVQELTWGPGGGAGFVFSASPDGNDFDLYLDGGGAVATSPGADGGPRWSPNGAMLVFTSARTGGGDLYLLDAETMEEPARRLTNAEGSSELFPDWASDSQRLVYVAHSETGDHLWLFDDVSGEPRQLSFEPGSQVRPRFSPDGSRVAYYAQQPREGRNTTEHWDLMVRGVDSDAPVRLLRHVKPDLAGPTWTPSGSHLLVVRDDPRALDPLAWVPATTGADPRPTDLDLGTVNHGDLALVTTGDIFRVAFISQGRATDPVRGFKRLYVVDLPSRPSNK